MRATPDAAGFGTPDMVGRARDLQRIQALLQEGTRLLMLRGPGGIGKTLPAFFLILGAVFVPFINTLDSRIWLLLPFAVG